MVLPDEKIELRMRLRRERNQKFIPSSFEIILQLPEVIYATVITSYISYESEPSTEEINREILACGKTLLLPRIKNHELEWVRWDGDEQNLKRKKKIAEPTGEAFESLDSIQVVIVPALHIDQEGYRLGQGGGYYDKALPKLKAWKIGIVHAGELSSQKLPRETHDVPLDAAATPLTIIRFRNN